MGIATKHSLHPISGFTYLDKNSNELDLIEATRANREDLVISIINADPSQKLQTDSQSRTALHWATEYGYSRIAQRLLSVHAGAVDNPVDFADNCILLDVQDSKGQTALHVACNMRREDLASLYVSLKANLNTPDHSGNTVLHRAIRMNLETTALMLCELGANTNAVNDLFWTPLHEAARTGNENIMAKLIRHGSEVDAMTHNKMTPFLTAFFYYKIASRGTVYSNLESVWKTLVEAGCQLSQTDGHWTPLTAALACDSGFIAALLLFNGCRVDKVGRWGHGILQDAFACSEPMIVKLLVLLGYIPTQEEVAHCSKQIPMYSRVFTRLRGLGCSLHRDRQEVVRWLHERREVPPSLGECCRVSIRAAMNSATGDRSILANFKHLPIPVKLQQFIGMSDFTHYLLDS
ncbi:26S proteasome non-ATPase regulatory subunit 10 [Elysia marginata]|uniref:26S proteasome non-ATPase regulatory subunit 10 n=1 Tax=Elysia marginata TaxID=1093978 RepID=A0AAV4F440_9GAST|nr:26S proteasome non-ATPase regulatory subunit 10 [Elysia marginata]